MSGGIILPATAIIALPHRIYHSCKQKPNETEVRTIMRGGWNYAALHNISMYSESPFSSYNKTRFLLQSRTRIPMRIILFQNFFLIIAGYTCSFCLISFPFKTYWLSSAWTLSDFLEYIYIYKDYISYVFAALTHSLGFFSSVANPGLVSKNLEYIKFSFKSILGIKTKYSLDDENMRLAIEILPDAIALHHNDYALTKDALTKEIVAFCPKHKLKNVISEFESITLTKRLKMTKTSLTEIFPTPIVQLIQDYSESHPLYHMFKNALKYQSDTTVSIPPSIKHDFEETTLLKKKRVFGTGSQESTWVNLGPVLKSPFGTGSQK